MFTNTLLMHSLHGETLFLCVSQSLHLFSLSRSFTHLPTHVSSSLCKNPLNRKCRQTACRQAQIASTKAFEAKGNERGVDSFCRNPL